VDFWVWVVILIVAWALEAVAGLAKKKRALPPEDRPPVPRRPPVQRRPPPTPRPPLPDARSEPLVIRRPRPVEVNGEDRESAILIEVPVRRPPRRPRDLESIEPLEGISAEVTRSEEAAEATEPQHVRALEKYGPATVRDSRSKRLSSRRMARIREAVIWMELLGPPKGLR
jgi:hypothetical protein